MPQAPHSHTLSMLCTALLTSNHLRRERLVVQLGWWLRINHLSLKVKLIYGPLLLLFLFYSRATQGTQCPTMFHGAAGSTAAPHEGWG